MIIAITGGTGFIGERLVRRHLELGDTVRVLSRKPVQSRASIKEEVTTFCGDLADDDCDLTEFVSGVDILYHCAGEVRNPTLMHALHIDGTSRLIAAAAGNIGRWVQLSSVGAYGPVADGIVTEETLPAPVGPYEVSKTVSDELVMKASVNGDFCCSILRPSNVYGPTMRNQSLFQLITMINRGLFFYIGKPGSLANYIHVDNVVDALVLCGHSKVDKTQVYNLSDSCTLEFMVERVSDLLGRRPPRIRVPELCARAVAGLMSGMPRFPLSQSRINALTVRASYSTDRISKELGYSHNIGLDEGLSQMVAAWRGNGISE
ncbi:NAD-dependent epimerase/dehydratase family protein [Metapseudomonas furukawaii]|uniref:NAD-dependent epimerase/dehydratase family protein n=1 Tax=Metapseudomonas furukawaii TaxID=1149133 RepID=UPI001314E19C|nr:NAD(P)-dependent oxidoreductase [Pseudomonas furukawaii]